MTRVVTKRIATVILGDRTPLEVAAEYESDGGLNCLILKQRSDCGEDMVIVAELEYVVKLVDAIRAVVPGVDAVAAEGGER